MTTAEVLAILKKEKPKMAAQFGLEELALFGSYARGEETSESDVDLLVTLKSPNYSHLISIMNYFENKFHKKIDIVRKGPHLTARFFQIIGKDIIYV